MISLRICNVKWKVQEYTYILFERRQVCIFEHMRVVPCIDWLPCSFFFTATVVHFVHKVVWKQNKRISTQKKGRGRGPLIVTPCSMLLFLKYGKKIEREIGNQGMLQKQSFGTNELDTGSKGYFCNFWSFSRIKGISSRKAKNGNCNAEMATLESLFFIKSYELILMINIIMMIIFS